jgi:peptidoglycan/LPS O-acetylase OafA/YrhL
MATTEDRLTKELESLYESPAARIPDARPEPQTPVERTRAVVSAKDARRLLFAWAAVIGAIMLFEPRPDNAGVAVPVWAEFAAFGFLTALFATAFGFGNRRPWASGASLVAVGFGAVLAIACAATDHHTGSWWIYELVAFGGLGLMTLGAARRAR